MTTCVKCGASLPAPAGPVQKCPYCGDETTGVAPAAPAAPVYVIVQPAAPAIGPNPYSGVPFMAPVPEPARGMSPGLKAVIGLGVLVFGLMCLGGMVSFFMLRGSDAAPRASRPAVESSAPATNP